MMPRYVGIRLLGVDWNRCILVKESLMNLQKAKPLAPLIPSF